jgi:DNA-binding transcriptional LysR family regulator
MDEKSEKMNLRQIRYFCSVVEAGSAVHAAEQLFVAPTAISMQISQLEQQLGGLLFDRSRRPMELTSLGLFFYPRAKELLAASQRLDEEAQTIAQGNCGWLAIGFARSALFSVLPASVRLFREKYSDVHLDLFEELSEYQTEQLHKGRIDIGISRFIGPYPCPDDLHAMVLFEDPFVAALPLDHPLAKKPRVTVQDLEALPYILYPKDSKSPFGAQMRALLGGMGANPVVSYEAIEIHTALALVGAGLGFTLVGRSISVNNRADVAFVPVESLETSSSMVAFSRRDNGNAFVDHFLEVLAMVSRDELNTFDQTNTV